MMTTSEQQGIGVGLRGVGEEAPSAICRSAMPGWLWLAFGVLLGTVLMLQLVHVLFFNTVTNDDGIFISYALNVAHGQLGPDSFGNIAHMATYFFGYPFLYPWVISKVFALLGKGYVAAKLLPLACYWLTLTFVWLYAMSVMGPSVASLVTILLAVDPAFWRAADQVRPQAALALFFTLSAITCAMGTENRKPIAFFGTGVVAGLSLLIGLSGIWLVGGIGLYLLVLTRDFDRRWKDALHFAVGLSLVVLPYVAWIGISPVRRTIFAEQIHVNTVARVHGFELVVKRLLNPAADLYLLAVKAFSPYPFVLAVVLLVLLVRWRRYCLWLSLLVVHLGMLMFTSRASHYFVMTMPIGYLGLGYVLLESKSFWHRLGNRPWRVWGGGVVVAAMIFGLTVGAVRALKKPDLNPARPYYRTAFETYTEPGSIIVTDLSLILSATGGRRFLSISLFVWDRWRFVYPYRQIVETLDPDYVVMTDRIRAYALSDHPQTAEFKEFLYHQFVLTQYLPSADYGNLWIYQRQRGS